MAGTAIFECFLYSAAGVSLGAVTMGGSGNSRTLTSAQFGNTAAYAVVTAELNGTSDISTVIRTNAGVTGVSAIAATQTNEYHVLPLSGGVPSSYLGTGQQIRVYEGGTELTFVGTATDPAAGQWALSPPIFAANAYNTAGTPLGSVTLSTVSTLVRTLSVAQFVANAGTNTVRVSATMGAYSGTVTIHRNNNGSSAVQAILSNEAHTLPTTSAGVVTYTGSGSVIRVFEGATELDYDGLGNTAGKWTATRSVTSGTITAGAISESGLTGVMAVHSGMTTDAAQITVTITGRTAANVSFSLTKIQSLAKSWQGATGTGTTGSTGTSTHRVYRTVTIGASKLTPSNTTNGAVPTSPATWYAAPQTVSTGQEQYQSDGTTLSGQTTTTWTLEYPSYLKVGSLDAISATIGTLRTATSGARTEIKDNVIDIYDASNVLRVKIGVWT
jgi:hypothetical protein